MDKKNNWQEFKKILEQNGIKKLYHFTDRDNLESIISHGALLSWADCLEQGIKIPKPGGSQLSWNLDQRAGLEHYVHTSFVTNHPMQYVAMNDGRITNPVLLEIDLDVIYWQSTKYSDMNAAKTSCVNVGGSLEDFMKIHFSAVKTRQYFDLSLEEQPYYQAEVLVEGAIPLKYITNIHNFGINVPNQPEQLISKQAYSALITRDTPTAFIFLVDQSVSMKRSTVFDGENMSLAEAVARIVNNQIKELVQRCIKLDEVRHYYDIAVIGYGDDAYSAWQGNLAGRDWVSPQEINDNPFKTITVREEKRTRRGVEIKEIEKNQWIDARCDGHWTHLHAAFNRAFDLLTDWFIDKQPKDCYPPTIINITDGQYNHISQDEIVQKANELKSLGTNDGNVILINVHVTPQDDDNVVFPISKAELADNSLGKNLYELSSLLPLRYNEAISDVRGDVKSDVRHVGLCVNATPSMLVQIMEIGTPTNIKR